MLGEHAFGYVGGAGSCAGCGEAHGRPHADGGHAPGLRPESMGIVAATGCNTVYGSTYPFNPFIVPWTNSLFENGPADAMGIRLRWDQAGHPERRLWVIGGDGAMYDIGFQSLSRMVASGMDIKVLVLDTRLLEHRRPGLHGLVRRPGDQARRRSARPSTASASGARSWAGS